jgi:hypothetical protein
MFSKARIDMTEKDTEIVEHDLASLLEADLLNRYGPLLSGENLRFVLAYSSMEAMRKAASRGTIPVPIFKIENRRGRFALVKDVAKWLAENRNNAE